MYDNGIPTTQGKQAAVFEMHGCRSARRVSQSVEAGRQAGKAASMHDMRARTNARTHGRACVTCGISSLYARFMLLVRADLVGRLTVWSVLEGREGKRDRGAFLSVDASASMPARRMKSLVVMHMRDVFESEASSREEVALGFPSNRVRLFDRGVAGLCAWKQDRVYHGDALSGARVKWDFVHWEMKEPDVLGIEQTGAWKRTCSRGW